MGKYWIISSNPDEFDVEKAFEEDNSVEWDRGRYTGINKDDIVYIYISKPIQAMKFKTKVANVIENIMVLKLVKRLNPEKFSLNRLQEHGLNRNVQGKITITGELFEYIKQQEQEPLNQILYGPPGTGKTYSLSSMIDQFTQNLNINSDKDIDDAMPDMLKIENYTWYQVSAAILYDAAMSKINNGWIKIRDAKDNNDIVSHDLFKARSEKSSSKSPQQTMAADLLFHTKDDCKNVNVKRKSPPFIFDKNNKSEWSVDTKILNDECPEAIELYEKYKKIKDKKIDINYTKQNFKFT